MSDFDNFRKKYLDNPTNAKVYIEMCDEEISCLVLENKALQAKLDKAKDALQWYFIYSSTKEPAKSALKELD